MIPVLAVGAGIFLACECHKARERERRWREQARLAEVAMEARDRAEAQRDALAIGLLADSFMELGQLSYYDAGEWEQ